MKSTFARAGLSFVVFLIVGGATASSAPTSSTSSKDTAIIKQIRELLHTRSQLAILQLRLAKEIQERLSHLHPKTKRCVIGLPGAMDNCDIGNNPDEMHAIWESGAGRRRAVLGGGASDNMDGQQAIDALGNLDIYTASEVGKRGLLGIAGGADNFDGQGALDARNQYNAFNDPNMPGKKRRGLMSQFPVVGDDNLFDFDDVSGPGKRGTLLGLAGGSDNFDGQGAMDARNQYELFNSGRTPGKRTHEK